MSGHSKWANIKHRKGAQDAKKANVFTKMARLISIAAREGGADLDTNFKLKMVVDKARSVNMPKDNIERAIKSGTGELKDGVVIEEIEYEAYGPGNIAMIIEVATDNKNRTVSELKHILSKNGGKMVPNGSVGFLFKKSGVITVATKEGDDMDELELQAIDAGAEDTEVGEEVMVVYTKPEELQKTRNSLDKAGLQIENAELAYVPIQSSEASEKEKESYERLYDALDENDDVQQIYDNLG
ncbi:MAG: YebC/PmpR family DNA-binding transcriptional regulator [Candidatus Moranbacteria bacterium]|nr:YebC/PmpR family DNA-binding transcriptional regulator [Candidatus Moranbacteria bacterium]